ncbi:hypothetical protein HUW51_14200 [Adhaeribacter swui]|uniref:Glycosyltransferase family 61 protein n=2 Tax=Adhaeribacter swui TaxID=2086471 RepID=A0A7G7GFB1_9BACT|nr:hypothetical protein HUW51_14200 [Adhaeribacter swui]
MPQTCRYFIRYFYLGKIVQCKYFIHDFILKKPYKVICYNSEFAPELKFVVPFAYWHHLNGTLKQTYSSKQTKGLYFFSENHIEKYEERVWCDFNYDIEIPNSQDHSLKYDYSKWAQVPFKSHYKNNLFIFDKPIVVIANRYNSEWDGGPISYIDIPSLEYLIKVLSPNFTLIYNRPSSDLIVNDNSKVYNLNEKEVIRNKYYDKILFAEDLFNSSENKFDSFNQFQLMLYANCEKFISVHGGTAVLASYFGGKNIILSSKGIEHVCNEFETIFPKLSGAKIYVAKSCKQLLELVENVYLNE